MLHLRFEDHQSRCLEVVVDGAADGFVPRCTRCTRCTRCAVLSVLSVHKTQRLRGEHSRVSKQSASARMRAKSSSNPNPSPTVY